MFYFKEQKDGITQALHASEYLIDLPNFAEISEDEYFWELEKLNPTEPISVDERLTAVEESQLILMEAMADEYEQTLERELNNMEVQAAIYEAILELGGNL